MSDELKISDREKNIPFIGPGAARRRRLVEILNKFLEDEVSIAELQGVSKEKLFLLAEAGYVKFKHGRVDEAEKIYQALLVLDHRNAYYHSVMGAIHQKKKRPVEAILEYTRALELDKNDISCYVNRGEIYLRHKNFRRAAEDFRQSIVMDATGTNMWANRSRSLVIALKRSLEAQKARASVTPAARPAPSIPKDAAAYDAGRTPKDATPIPPTRRTATPTPRARPPTPKNAIKKKY